MSMDIFIITLTAKQKRPHPKKNVGNVIYLSKDH